MRNVLPFAISAAAGAAYGVLARLIFGSTNSTLTSVFSVMTIGFLFLMPIGLGALTVVLFGRTRGWAAALFAPWLSVVLFLAAVWLLNIEGAICIAMALPVFLVFSSFGGIVTWLAGRQNAKLLSRTTVALVILPFLVAPAEHEVRPDDQHRSVVTSIDIAAPAGVVWSNIAEVPTIAAGERPFRWSRWIGIPDPIEARLTARRVGGVRRARFTGGIEFREVVTRWDPERSLAFVIHANTSEIPATSLDEHVLVGGRYFDVLDGRFDIEPLSPGQVRLHLVSTHRLTTDFNGYAGIWTNAIMRNVQDTLLEVIRVRSEKAAAISRRPASTAAAHHRDRMQS